MTITATPPAGQSVNGVPPAQPTGLVRSPVAWPLEDNAQHGYRLLIAADQATRDRAYTLAYHVYSAHGYAQRGLGRLVWPYDAEQTTSTLLVEDARGAAVATATLVYDRPCGLPADGLFPHEMAALRARTGRLVEVCRLCIAPEHRQARVILLRLINALYIHIVRVGQADDLVIEVHPRRAPWYTSKLLFEQIGSVRACASVGGQPTVLLRCQSVHYDRHVPQAGGLVDRGLLYSDFYSRTEEGLLADAMARQARQMSPEEAMWFGLNAPASSS